LFVDNSYQQSNRLTHYKMQNTFQTNLQKALSVCDTLGRNLISLDQISQSCVEETEQFVIRTCGSRPSSHNHLHMQKVRDNAVWILSALVSSCFFGLTLMFLIAQRYSSYPYIILPLYVCTVYVCKQWVVTLNLLVQIVALLHDVADHKYVEEDITLLPNLDRFIEGITSNEEYERVFMYSPFGHLFRHIQIKNIIDRISFSRQKKYGTYDWVVTLGYAGVLVRNIVSDADKFEAIGQAGIDRCVEYTQEVYDRTGVTKTRTQLLDDVEKHYHEKLKLLASMKYMKTGPGLLYAQRLDSEMLNYLRTLRSQIVN
ncbi:metal dependent phosphohydrolase, partial [Yasminevirus sp. GU-2018]